MPVPVLSGIVRDGFHSIPYLSLVVRIAITIAALYYLKIYFGGTQNKAERVLHGKVAIITGGTSGIGAAVAKDLAQRGAQLVLLTRQPLNDPFLVDYIDDLRRETNNQLVTVEQVNLADLHSIRKFATKWIDNAPPRRLDLLVLCADEMTPASIGLKTSADGAELMMAVNYLSNFHLVSIMSPALRAQPPDRDVRVVIGMCSSYLGGDLGSIALDSSLNASTTTPKSSLRQNPKSPAKILMSHLTPAKIYYTTKLALLTFSSALQKHLTATPRKDGLPPNVRVICVDPGWTRTPGMRRHLTRGSLWGLLVYLLTYPLWFLVLKSPIQGAQSFLFAVMEAGLGTYLESNKTDVVLVRECGVVPVQRAEVHDEAVQKRLWETTEQTIEALEKQSALTRAREKKERQRQEAKESPSGGDVKRTLNSKGKGVSFAE